MAISTAFSDLDPNDIDALRWNWSRRLAEVTPAETISTSTFTVPAGITKDSESNTTTTATIVVSGGTLGQHDILNRIVTSGGRQLDQTFRVPVSEQ